MSRRCSIVLVLMLGATSLSACGAKPPASTVTSPVTGPSLIVTPGQVEDLKPVAGTLTSYKMAEASSRLEGTLAVLNVREGDVVRKGQVIGFVRDSRIAPQTTALSAQVTAAQAQAAQADVNYQRVKTLYDKGIYAKAALDQAEANMKSASAGVAAASAQTAASAAYGEQGAILSPDDGKVIKADVPKGAVVMMGQSIATITSGALVVRLDVPEAQGRGIAAGQSVRLEADGRSAIGAVTRVYPSVTQGQITADVTPVGFESLPVGSRVTAYVSMGERTAVVVPRTYVVTRFGLDYVRLVQPNGDTIETTVETAPYDGAQIEILGGLSAGDRIVAYGGAR